MKKLKKILKENNVVYVDTSILLCSMPPQYNFYLDEKGYQFAGYIFCHECNFIDE